MEHSPIGDALQARARWIIAASLMQEAFGTPAEGEPAPEAVQLSGCRGVLTETQSEVGCICDIIAVGPEGAHVVARAARPPTGEVHLDWKSKCPAGGPHRFEITETERLDERSWSLALRWVGVDAPSLDPCR